MICPACRGSGHDRRSINFAVGPSGTVVIRDRCTYCGGSGEAPKRVCRCCGRTQAAYWIEPNLCSACRVERAA
jgi:DnaJ-class molecular chaperone